jgi:hypothetical protein
MSRIVQWLIEHGVALGAVVVSVIALWKSSKSHRQQFDLNRRMVAIEVAREGERRLKLQQAHLHAYIDTEVPPYNEMLKNVYLVVENRGKSKAFDIEIQLDGKPWSVYGWPNGKMDQVQSCEPGSSPRYLLKKDVPEQNLNQGARVDIQISWRDQTPKLGNYQQSLTW